MPFIFDIKKTVNALVFLINSLGGKSELYRLGIILYFADLKHLSKYGTFILGDTYVAMKFGPMPFNTLNIYKQLKGEGFSKSFAFNFKEYFRLVDDTYLEVSGTYDIECLSESEVECIFASIREHKEMDFDSLTTKAKNTAWQQADSNGEIAFKSIMSHDITNSEMMDYINMSFNSETNSFHENSEA